jgi:hypothetical protein
MPGALATLHDHARRVAAAGRYDDSELVHVSRDELKTLAHLNGGHLTVNPKTGLPEAFSLGGILGSIGGALLPVLAPGIGDSIGGLFGLTGDTASAVGGALAGGGLGLLGNALGGGKGNPLLYGGLGALAGGLGGYFGSDIRDTLGLGSAGLMDPSTSLFSNSPDYPSGYITPPDPSTGLAAASTNAEGVAGANAPSGLSQLLGGGSGSGSSGSGSWLSRNLPLVAGGLLLAGAMGSKNSQASKPKLSPQQKEIIASNSTHAQNFDFNRVPVPSVMNPTSWYTLNNQNSGQPILFYNNPAGTYTPSSNPIPGLGPTGTPAQTAAHGGHITGYARGGLTQLRTQHYVPGPDGGQDDTIPARLSNGEYVIDATTVSDLGDGNNEAGARKLDELRDRIAHQKGRKRVVPPRAKDVGHYLGGRS